MGKSAFCALCTISLWLPGADEGRISGSEACPKGFQTHFFVQFDSLALAPRSHLPGIRASGFWPVGFPAVKGLHFRKKMCPGTLDSALRPKGWTLRTV